MRESVLSIMLIFLIVLPVWTVFTPKVSATGSASTQASPYLYDDFSSLDSAQYNVKHAELLNAGIADPGATDGKVLQLVFPAGDLHNHPTDGPTVKTNQEYSFGTFRARMKAVKCKQDEGVVSAFFTYYDEGPTADDYSEIDFEILGASSYIVYMTVWARYVSDSDFKATVRAVNLATGEYWETNRPSYNYKENPRFPTHGFLRQGAPIPGYDASTDYYEYGFTWLQNSVDFFVVDTHGNVIDLWPTPPDVPVPTHPARLCLEVWHPGPPVPPDTRDTSWTPLDKPDGTAVKPPSTDAVFRVDRVEYNSESLGAIGNGLYWLQNDQNKADYSWSYGSTENVGITSLSTLAFLNVGILNEEISRALDWIVSKRTNYGAITTPATGGREENSVYDTSMAILALVAGETLGYTLPFGPNVETVINNAATYLIHSQCVGLANDGYDYPFTDLNYGGWGYPRYDWADLSNTQFAVLGLAAASIAGMCSVPATVWENAAVFTIRCLNDARFNPNWHGTTDFGFGYRPEGSSYESMTGAGVWCLGLCRAHVSSVTVDGVTVPLDSAISDGVGWLQAHASVDENYGNGNYFYYYALMSVAKGYVIVNQGLAWHALMAIKLIFDQASDGRWASKYWEEPDTMATAEAILALETSMAPPSTISPELHVILGSYANLYITDPAGRHVGIDPNTGQVINEIPDATFSVDSEQTASIPYPQNGTYVVSIVGTGAGPYNLTVEGEINGTMTSVTSFLGSASRGVTQEWSATVAEIFGPFTVITTPRIHIGLAGDVNGDDKVDVKDVFLVYKAFGSSSGSPNWNPLADLNGDGNVDVKDVFIVAKNFGKQYA